MVWQPGGAFFPKITRESPSLLIWDWGKGERSIGNTTKERKERNKGICVYHHNLKEVSSL